mgnify:CR=1 FL=1
MGDGLAGQRHIAELAVKIHRAPQVFIAAVHGAAARMMVPAMYWSASAAGIHDAKSTRKNSQAMAAIENGLTTQLTKSVTNRPRGRRQIGRAHV